MPFQKGQSGNPAGRPRNEQTITTVLRRLLLEKEDGKARAEHVAISLIRLARAGDVNAIKLVFERIDGKVTEPVDVTTDGHAFSFSIQRAEQDASDSD
jgi:hypothetical protein